MGTAVSKPMRETLNKLLHLCVRYNSPFQFLEMKLSNQEGNIRTDAEIQMRDYIFQVDKFGNTHRIGGGNGVYKPNETRAMFAKEFGI
jgi:type IV secretory pathway TrbF-like protein